MGLRTLRFLFVAFGLLSAGQTLRAADELDWDAWEQIPVLHDGRIKPLDTFARMAVREICGSESPPLGPAEADDEGALHEARGFFPADKPRKFRASELLFSWIVEPEKWESVPFLPAADAALRADVLGVPLRDARGTRLERVSPRQVADAMKGPRAEDFHARLTDRNVEKLYTAYNRYEYLIANLTTPRAPRDRLTDQLQRAVSGGPDLDRFLFRSESGGQSDSVSEAGRAANEVLALLYHGSWSPEEVPRPLLIIQQSAAQWSAQLESHLRQVQGMKTGDEPKRLEEMKTKMRALIAKAAEMAREAGKARSTAIQYAQFGNRYSLTVVPGLNPAALERKRDPDRDVSPWLDLATVLQGGDLGKQYPRAAVEEVRRSFKEAAAAYRDREAPDRPQRFAAAMDRFALGLAALGEEIEPVRQELPIRNWDEGLMARTAYPAPRATWIEVHYNRLDPFHWTWVLSLAAFVAAVGAVGPVRKPAFWVAVGLLAAAGTLMVYGFTVRTLVTGYTPVATMFETVTFMALVVALLGLWLVLFPILRSGLRLAWQWTALPLTWEPAPPQPQQPSVATGRWRAAARALAVLARAALAVGVFYALTQVYFGEGSPGQGEPVVLLLPRVGIGASLATIGELLIWMVGLVILAASLYYLPRAILAAAISLVTVPLVLAKEGLANGLRQALGRKAFVVCGAGLAAAAGYAACHVPIFDASISTLQPILRHSFWLAVHVATIMASYGAGALAWGVGCITLGHYVFGHYRDPAREEAEPAAAEVIERKGAFQAPSDFTVRRAPEACATLSVYTYKLVQFAAILVFVGTILGAAWADKAWGRYWGWDPKEVWALVCFLVYMVIVHGRHTGWIGNFGLAAGTVLEGSAIMMTWYGVGAGKHAYGTGTSGLLWVLLAIAINWLYVGVAWLRYWTETHILAQPDTPTRPKA